MKALVADPIADEGVELLRHADVEVDVITGLAPAKLLSIIDGYDALIVRSETKVTSHVLAQGHGLRVVGRAGVGVDNIDLEAATHQGVLVVNAPTANIVAAAEHTMALMLALARHVPQANAALRAGRWARSDYVGSELMGKTLGIIGLGKVGSDVARRAKGFELRLLGHDPFVSKEYAEILGVELASVEEVLRESDFITVHVPKAEGTRHLIGEPELRTVKPTVRIINVARGGIIDEEALFKAVDEGRVAGAAVDTFEVEPTTDNPLFRSDRIIVTPHLGASTIEAQAHVAVEVAEQVLEVLRGRPAKYALNAPMVLPEALAVLAPYVDVAHIVGKVATQLAHGQMQAIKATYAGEIARHDKSILRAALIQGLLEPVTEERVNLVNADLIASQRGMHVEERDADTSAAYRSLLTLELTTATGQTRVSGTSISERAHIVGVDDYPLNIRAAEGYMLFIENQDQPGLIGAVGTIAGQNDVNISFMEVGRVGPRDRAMMAVGLDEPMPQAAIDAMLELPGFKSVRQVKV